MKYLGLDVGDRRIGVAFGDSALRLATPVQVIVRTSAGEDVRSVAALAQKYGVDRVVVGLPRNMDGTEGTQTGAARAFAERIGQALALPLVLWDERLTTVEATRRSHEMGARGKKSRRSLDALAAALILEDYMAGQKDESENAA